MNIYTVDVYDLDKDDKLFSLNLKVKHFRQFNGNKIDTYGGSTAIFCIDNGLVFSSKCRSDEQFSRRKGLLTCLQKMLQSTALHPHSTKSQYWINDCKFTNDGLSIWIGEPITDERESNGDSRYFWLKQSGITSGLYGV